MLPILVAIALAEPLPDLGPHPRLLLTADDLPLVRDRLQDPPYTNLLARTVSWCARDHDLSDTSIGAVQLRGNTARACAWLAVVDRTLVDGAVVQDDAARDGAAAKAAALLLSMPTTSRATPLDAVLDIHTAQELHLAADTLDLLLATDALGDDRARAVQQVADLAADFYADHILDDSMPWTRSLLNNHRSKSAGALGLAALALDGESWEPTVGDGRYDPTAWLDFGLSHGELVATQLLVDPDGGYPEGPNYLAYGWMEVLPFFWAWDRLTDGASRTVRWDPAEPPYLVTGAPVEWTVESPWRGGWLDAQLTWAALTTLPDGTFAPTDDSTPGSTLWFGAFVDADRFADAGLYRWAWERAGQPSGGSVDPSPWLVLAYDDQVPAVSPVEAGLEATQVLPHSGQAWLRSGWGEDAVVAVLLAEHGPAAAHVHTRWGQSVDSLGGHEHPDVLSVSLYAGTRPLLLDSGYLGWDEHGRVNQPDNHSLILVDGEGPEGAYAHLPPVEGGDDGGVVFLDPSVEGGWAPARDGQGWIVAQDVDDPRLHMVHAVTTYDQEAPATDLSRTAVLLWGEDLVLLDTAVALDRAEHTYTHQLHLGCGGTEEGELALTEAGARCTWDDAELEVGVVADGPVELSTREAEHDTPGRVARTHTVLDTEVVGVGARLATVATASSVTAEGRELSWERDGRSCTAWTGEVREHGLTAASGVACTEGDAILGVWADLEGAPGSLVSGELRADGWRLTVHAGEVVSLPAVAGAEPDGACAWEVDGDTWWVEAPRPGVVETAAAARSSVPGVALHGDLEPPAVTTGEAVELVASGCAPEATWSLERAPLDATAGLEADGERAVLVPDLPGVWTVRRTTADGQVAERTLTSLGEPVPREPEDTGLTDTGTPEDPGCGCSSGVAGGWWLALLPLVGRRRQ